MSRGSCAVCECLTAFNLRATGAGDREVPLPRPCGSGTTQPGRAGPAGARAGRRLQGYHSRICCWPRAPRRGQGGLPAPLPVAEPTQVSGGSQHALFCLVFQRNALSLLNAEACTPTNLRCVILLLISSFPSLVLSWQSLRKVFITRRDCCAGEVSLGRWQLFSICLGAKG